MWDELLTPMEEAPEAMHAWAVAEVENGGIAPITHQAPEAARDIADLLAARAEVVLIGGSTSKHSRMNWYREELTGSTWCQPCWKS
jgi:hypothetical protein